MNAAIRAYRQQRRAQIDRDALFDQYAPLVRKVAFRLLHRLPASVEVEDLISVGCIGLIHAIEHFDPTRGKRFAAFAEFRIKGAMLDELRACDFMSRTARGRVNKLERARRKLEARLGRQVSCEELAQETQLTLAEVERLRVDTSAQAFLTVEDLSLATEQTRIASELLTGAAPEDPFGHVLLSELRGAVSGAVAALPERLQLVLSLYYQEELNFKEIGHVLEVTESRVSQLHTQAVGLLRKKLRRAA